VRLRRDTQRSKSLTFRNAAKKFKITGYLQSWRYFPSDLGTRMAFKGVIRDRNREYLNRVKSGRVSVGIHVRHKFEGDGTTMYLKFPEPGYFEGVLRHFRTKHGTGNVIFIVTGDDQSYLKNAEWIQGQPDIHIVKTAFNDPVDDMAILSLCNNMAMTVGTFGWWASFLGDQESKSDRDVIYYSDMFKMDAKPNVGNVVLEDHFPSHWLKMDDTGRCG